MRCIRPQVVTRLVLARQDITNPIGDLRAYRECWRYRIGAIYIEEPTDPDAVTVADVGVSLLMNSRADSSTARTVHSHGAAMASSVALIPKEIAIEDDSASEHLNAICDAVALMTSIGRDRAPNKSDPLPSGIGISIATKIIHRKRPRLIPILDNDAIFALHLG